MRLKIISGGQTGVDRAALDAAMALGIPHGGYVPKGRLAEDGAIDPKYELRETASTDYAVRTEQNVQWGDVTLILHFGPLSGGTQLTRELCLKHRKPHYLLDLKSGSIEESCRKATALLEQYPTQVLTVNVAGPRESQAPGIYKIAYSALLEIFKSVLSLSEPDQLRN